MNRNGIRPVTIASVCSRGGKIDTVLALAEEAAKQKPDLILMPEGWHYQGLPSMDEEANHPATKKLYEIAKEYGVYIVESSVRKEGDEFFNSAIVIDRSGENKAIYNKTYPYWPELKSEENPYGSIPGKCNQPVIDFDFGKVGIFICFDANFPDIWADAANQGAELILWLSAYGAGRQLEAHALNNHYYIVSATTSGHVMGIDINGERFVNTCSKEPAVQFVTVDLDRCIFHENYNLDILDELLAENPPKIEVEKHWLEEQWIVIRSAREGVSAREVCKNAGMEELRAYKRRSREGIDAIRREFYGE